MISRHAGEIILSVVICSLLVLMWQFDVFRRYLLVHCQQGAALTTFNTGVNRQPHRLRRQH